MLEGPLQCGTVAWISFVHHVGGWLAKTRIIRSKTYIFQENIWENVLGMIKGIILGLGFIILGGLQKHKPVDLMHNF